MLNLNKLHMKKYILLSILTIISLSLSAQSSSKLSFRFRTLMDLSLSSYDDKELKGYYKLEDFRVGFKVKHNKYEVKAEVGIGESGLAIKDLLFSYFFDNSVIVVGNGYESFSMDMLISSTDLRFHQSASSTLAFVDGRKFGATYHLNLPSIYWALGVYTNNDINKLGANQIDSYVSTSRLVFRTSQEHDVLLHIGGAFSYRTKPIDLEAGKIKTVKSSGVTSMFRESLLESSWEDWGSEQKGVVEALAMWPRFMIQGEYYINKYSRDNSIYMPHGGYVQAGFLLIGEGFNYDCAYAIPGRPTSDRALEFTTRFNYTNLDDADIYGGKEYDVSFGANWYLNQNLAIKCNVSYVVVGENCNSFYTENLVMGQLRVQYVF